MNSCALRAGVKLKNPKLALFSSYPHRPSTYLSNISVEAFKTLILEVLPIPGSEGQSNTPQFFLFFFLHLSFKIRRQILIPGFITSHEITGKLFIVPKAHITRHKQWGYCCCCDRTGLRTEKTAHRKCSWSLLPHHVPAGDICQSIHVKNC